MEYRNCEKLKVMTIIGTRPEIIRLSRIMMKLDEYVDHKIVYTGQNYDYELSGIFFQQLELRKPDYFLEVKSQTLGGQISQIIQKTESVFFQEKPDAVLILGDTNSALSAINAKRMKIPIFHMEAGNRCFDERVPEEINRKIVDHISDINLAYTEHARRNLLFEGIHPGTIYVTGTPLPEVLVFYENDIANSHILERLHLRAREYFLASIHREENVDREEAFQAILRTLNLLADKYNKPILLSTHPRTRKKLDGMDIHLHPAIRLEKPFGYFDYIQLQKNALCVLSDSGTVPEEAAILDFPAVQIRQSSERPEAFDTGSIILTGLDSNIILHAVCVVIDQFQKGEKFSHPGNYIDRNISSKVLRLILGLSKRIQQKRQNE